MPKAPDGPSVLICPSSMASPGAEAARNAISSMGGQRVRDGAYRVILGPQTVTELLEWILMPSLHLDMFYAGVSTFMGKFGQKVASEDLSLYDHGAAQGMAGSKAITDEGLPTGRTDLIQDGVLVGALSNFYETQRILNDPNAKDKLGVDPNRVADHVAPRNGFRTGRGGGRNFDATPSVTPTNLIVEGGTKRSQEELIRLVGDGLYIGRIWYTYPVNGIVAGDFSGTVVGDSYLIKDGKFAAPIKPNTIRMNENIHNVLNNIIWHRSTAQRHRSVVIGSGYLGARNCRSGLSRQRDRWLYGGSVWQLDLNQVFDQGRCYTQEKQEAHHVRDSGDDYGGAQRRVQPEQAKGQGRPCPREPSYNHVSYHGQPQNQAQRPVPLPPVSDQPDYYPQKNTMYQPEG